MRDQIVIRMPAFGGSDFVQWIRFGGASLTPVIKQGSLQDVAKEAAGATIIALASSSQVLLTHVSIPTKNRQKLVKAIPYALEEELASDVDQLHFAVGVVNESGKTPVAVVEKQLMEQWQHQIAESGLVIDTIIPEVLTVPIEENGWSLLLDDVNSGLRLAQFSGYGIDAENVEFILPLALAKEEDKPETITIYSKEELLPVSFSEMESVQAGELIISHQSMPQGLFGLLAKTGVTLQQAINLLQGEYSQREQLGKILRPWRFAAGMGAVWFVLQLTIAITESSQLETQSAALKAEAKQIFKDAIPSARKVVNPRAQMKQKLVELKSDGSGGDDSAFLTLLSDSGKAFEQTSGLVLRSVRYKNGVLDVEIDVPNLQALDKLKQALAANKGMSVEIQSAASRNNKVQGRLQIKGQS